MTRFLRATEALMRILSKAGFTDELAVRHLVILGYVVGDVARDRITVGSRAARSRSTWEVLLHRSTTRFHHAAQQSTQDVYKPIKARIRDGEPIVRKAAKGEFSIFHAFERLQRGAAMHLPM